MSLLKPKEDNLFQSSLDLVFLITLGVTTTGGTIFVISYGFDLELAGFLAGAFAIVSWLLLSFLYLRFHYSKLSLWGEYFD